MVVRDGGVGVTTSSRHCGFRVDVAPEEMGRGPVGVVRV